MKLLLWNQIHKNNFEVKRDPRRLTLFKSLLEDLDACQALPAFLESKSQGFQKVYFIVVSDLHDILGKVREQPDVVLTLKNILQGISSVQFDEENLVAFCSVLGEKFPSKSQFS